MFFRLKRGTAIAVVAGTVAYLYNPGRMPPGASSGVAKQAVAVG